ncbi:MAG: signal peptidase I [Syntrophobacterales bacterium]|jgi:signal peptidase I|nr:signal peptidase I [Syntrophobacterales bacterium]
MKPRTPGARLDSLKKPFWREYGEALFIALILALVIRAFLVQAFSIPSGSMQPTLLIGDYLLVNKFAYGIRNPITNKVWIPIGPPQRGDVVVFIFPQDPTKDYIKRIMGLPGDKIQIINKKIYINGKLTETPQAVYDDPLIIPAPQRPTDSARDNFGPVTVPANSYFVMGDNRDHSYDSRFWGFVPMDNFRGKAFIIYFSWQGPPGEPLYQAFLGGLKGLVYHLSWNSNDFKIRWDRIGKIIH